MSSHTPQRKVGVEGRWIVDRDKIREVGVAVLGRENRVGKLVKSDSSRTRADILCTDTKQQHASKLCCFSVHGRVNTH